MSDFDRSDRIAAPIPDPLSARSGPAGDAPLPPATAPFLELYVGDQQPLLLPMPSLVEIITPAVGEVVPMFHMPAWVMGVYNWRGSVLWMVDLSHFLGFQPWYESAQAAGHTAVVLDAAAGTAAPAAAVGLVVSRVEGMISCPTSALLAGTTADTPPALRPYAAGYWDGSGLAAPQPPRLILDGSVLLEALVTAATPEAQPAA